MKQADEQLEEKYRLRLSAISLQGFIHKVARYYKIEAENLASASKDRCVTEARRVLCYIVVRKLGYKKTQKDISKAVNKICKPVKGLIDVKITKGRKQICKRIPSTRRQSGDPIYENKWSFNYGLEWKINEQAVIDESRTDGLFPLITNNHLLDAGEVLRM